MRIHWRASKTWSLSLSVLLTISSATSFGVQDQRAFEIASWSFRDVTAEYPDVNQRYQDQISTCSEGLDLSQNPVIGGNIQQPPIYNPGVTPVEPTDPFGQQTRPNPNPGGGGLYGGSGGWSPVVDPSIGAGSYNQGGIDPATGQPRQGGINISDLLGLGIAVDVISNMGRRVWELVNLGKPTAWVNTNVAHGLPKGIKCWTDLQGWSWPQSKVYNVNYKNKLGLTVVDYTYRISYNYGGNIEGIGKYLSNVQIVPVNLKVSWGYSLNSRAEIPTVFNVGTKDNPVAGMQVNVRWKVESSLMNNEQSHMFHIGGDNLFKKVQE